MSSLMRSSMAALAVASTVYAGSIADIDHVVLFMQENRAFDHYFGTMAGVRNFKDPNVQVNGNQSVWYQNTGTLSTKTDTLLPWYLNYQGGTAYNATQCMTAGSNGWSANHAALNKDLNNEWPTGNTPYSWGHFTRKELPNHFAIAEAYTVGDMYQESVIASTNPNRVTWMSGTVNIQPGSPPPASAGGPYIDNNETPGCESGNINCYPLKWKTVPEYLQDAGVSWQVYQDTDNFDDNPLAWFAQFQTASNTSALSQHGLAYPGLAKFYSDAAAGTLPQVSYIVGPAELSEHPPYQPRDGGWLQQKIVDTVTQSPLYNKTALIISYDETGGWGDHVTPFHSPNGTLGEWLTDPYGNAGYTYSGPGFRLPFYIVSPWTRGGNVFVEHADHNSQILFLEKWLAAKNKPFTSAEVNPWRRTHMTDLTYAFDFQHPDYSIPAMPNISYPSTDSKGKWNGYSVCEATYAHPRPVVPYGAQDAVSALATEQGFKRLRGQPTEGRYLVFESAGLALTAAGGNLSTSAATSAHEKASQRFVLYESEGGNGTFAIGSVGVAGESVSSTSSGGLGKTEQGFVVKDLGSGSGYTVQTSGGKYLGVDGNGKVVFSSTETKWVVWSVSYDE